MKRVWQLPPSEAKRPSNISRTKNVLALKLPRISLTKGYFGQFKGYIFAVLGHFCFLLRLGGCGSQGRTETSATLKECQRISLGNGGVNIAPENSLAINSQRITPEPLQAHASPG